MSEKSFEEVFAERAAAFDSKDAQQRIIVDATVEDATRLRIVALEQLDQDPEEAA